ncbi:hypothetical protein NRB16_07895 [Pseudomonas sp. LJDD11]|uniref:hypothetical protein n=1 Tax=Pseudomonas sp. LJDD11 TaxID=2931984 RepID=UPI00211BC6AA|nr:hypothetical protein [Pseudomonas sp. LJDD11]MCQ9423441.1 hypothetical protein [Pseudomonas sp. LJDD11]
MKRHYNYAHAPQCQVGKMRCSSCGKKITVGQYRYHETADAYVPCHRSCCPNDPHWAELDRLDEETRLRRKQYESDVLAFFDKWGALDDEDFMSIVNQRACS